MSRYIDADLLEIPYGYCEDATECYEALEALPSIDIVRCKECKWASPNGKNGCALVPFAPINDRHYMYADDFCSYGEREGE